RRGHWPTISARDADRGDPGNFFTRSLHDIRGNSYIASEVLRIGTRRRKPRKVSPRRLDPARRAHFVEHAGARHTACVGDFWTDLSPRRALPAPEEDDACGYALGPLY